MLLRHPTLTLAWYSSDILADNKRYESVPILLRFALFEHDYGAGECRKALLRMGIAETAAAVIKNDARIYWREIARGSYHLSAEAQADLRSLLGVDAGTDLQLWQEAYETHVKNLPSPLNDTAKDEVLRVEPLASCLQVRLKK